MALWSLSHCDKLLVQMLSGAEFIMFIAVNTRPMTVIRDFRIYTTFANSVLGAQLSQWKQKALYNFHTSSRQQTRGNKGHAVHYGYEWPRCVVSAVVQHNEIAETDRPDFFRLAMTSASDGLRTICGICWRSITCEALRWWWQGLLPLSSRPFFWEYSFQLMVRILFTESRFLTCLDFWCNINLFHRTDTLRTACFWSCFWSSIIIS